MRLAGKKALVTGAGRGIGRAIALEFAGQGADVVVNYNKNEQAAASLVQEIVGMGRKSEAIKANVGDFEEAKNLFAEATEFLGGIDILVNNAGIVKDRALMRMTEEDWKTVIDCNLTGVFNVTRAAIVTLMKQKHGKIVNISSASGISGLPGQTNYSASKAGIIGFSKSLAKEVARMGVQVNVVAPGFIETEMLDQIPEKRMAEILAFVPLKRLGKPEEVAKMCTFLASAESDYVTGQVFVVDGGLTI